jgi:hypothetical protein
MTAQEFLVLPGFVSRNFHHRDLARLGRNQKNRNISRKDAKAAKVGKNAEKIS